MIEKINDLLERKKTIKNAWVFLLCVVVYLVISYRLFDKPGLYLADEFGFIAAPAYLSGFDWSEQISHISYYGIGYGLFIIPAFYICKTAHQLTTYILIVNSLLFICAVILSYRLINKLFPKENFIKTGIYTITASIYISNICFLHMGWSETMNLVLYWLILNLLYEVVKNCKFFNIAALAVVLCYAVIVHMRNISIVSACVVVLMWQMKLKKLNLKKIIVFLVIVMIGIVIFLISKRYIQQHLYNVSIEQNQKNDVIFVLNAGRNQIVSFGFVQVIKNFIVSVLGKIFYQISSTYGIIIFGVAGVYVCAKKNRNNENRAVLVCSLLMVLFSLFLSSYAMMSPARLDNIFYGRYVETTIGLLVSVGCFYFSNENISKIVKIEILSLLLYKIVIVSTIKKYSEMLSDTLIEGFVFQCSPGIAKYYLSGDIPNIIDKICQQVLVVIIILYVTSLVVGYCNRICKKDLKTLFLGIVAIILSIVWIKDSQIVVDGILSYENGYYGEAYKVLDNENDELILDYIKCNWSKNECQIYYYTDNIWNDHLLVVQYMIGKTPIININDLDRLEDNNEINTYVLLDLNDAYESKRVELENCDFQYCCSSREFILYKKTKN